MRILRSILSFILITAGILLFDLPVWKPACKRVMRHKSAATGKNQVPVTDMEPPASCNAVNLATGLTTVVYELPGAIPVKRNYPPDQPQFLEDPFPRGIYTPPRC